MKKVFLFILLSSFAFSQDWIYGLDNPLRDSSGFWVTKNFKKIAVSSLQGVGASGNADSLNSLPASDYFLRSDTTYLHLGHFLKSDTVNLKGGLLKNADSTTLKATLSPKDSAMHLTAGSNVTITQIGGQRYSISSTGSGFDSTYVYQEIGTKADTSSIVQTTITNNKLVLFRGDSAVASVVSQALGGDAVNIGSDTAQVNGSDILTKSNTPVIISIPLDSSYINTTDTVIVGSFPYAMTIDSLKFINQLNTGASVTYKVLFGTNILTGWTAVVSAGSASTSISIGDKVTSLDNTSVSANSYFAVLCSSVTTKPKKAVITIFAHR